MSIEGRIAVDVSFADSATSDGVQSLKKITLADTTSYTTGKVAIVTGTCGTTAVTLDPYLPAYTSASGQAVTFSSLTRVAFQGNPSARIVQGFTRIATSDRGGVAVNDVLDPQGGATGTFSISTTAGTASYTLVLYGT